MTEPLPDTGPVVETITLLSTAQQLLKRVKHLVNNTIRMQVKLRVRHEPMKPAWADSPKEVVVPSLQHILDDLSRSLAMVEENALAIHNTIGE